jgi:nicotinate phosphoribosyltransferase
MFKNLALFTDLYELTMTQAYFRGKNPRASFELFVRKFPPNRGYFIFAGLNEVCDFLLNFRFQKEDLEYLKEKGVAKDFLNFLKELRFSGDLWALEEGELVFPNEPIIRITGPIIEAQIFETFLLNAINFQTLIATKASRIIKAAKGRPIIDFGSRRAQGIDAGLKAARASYLAGCLGTSNVLAGRLYQIPIFGTMAHSFIQAFPDEKQAFRNWLKIWGEKTILLIDTYDTLRGVKNATEVVSEITGKKELKGVRLDSGNLLNLSKKVRMILDRAGFHSTKIFISGGLDEYKIEKFLGWGAKMDVFGVGTSLVTSDDAPSLDAAYKLVEIEEGRKFRPKMKIAEREKETLPGPKQIFRFEKRGKFSKDVIGLSNENLGGKKMLIQIFKKWKLIYKPLSLNEIREKVRENLKKLPEKYQKIKNPAIYPVKISKNLFKLREKLKKVLA